MSDSYYDPPDTFGDHVANLMDEINEFMVERNPPNDPHEYDEEWRQASCILESFALAILKDGYLYEAIESHLRWAKSGYPKRTNVYEDNADLYEESV